MEWGWRWRIPFLIAAPIGLVGFYLRNKLEETPAFDIKQVTICVVWTCASVIKINSHLDFFHDHSFFNNMTLDDIFKTYNGIIDNERGNKS